MSKTFDKEIDFYIGGVKVGGSTISKSPDDKHLDTQAAEDEFYAILRKHEASILEEAADYERSYIIDHLTSEQEPDIDAIEEARFISAQTRIQDEKEAAELGMTIEEFYKERDAMLDAQYVEDTNVY